MTSFHELDPTSAGDPRLDPESDTGRGARAAAMVRGEEPAPAQERTRRRLVPALGAAGLAGVVAAAVLLASGGEGNVAPTDALAEAAEKTAAASSGVITFTQRLADDGGVTGASRQDVRFDGSSVAITNVTESVAPEQEPQRSEREEIVIDDRHWVRKDGGAWVVKTEATEGDAADLRAFVASEVDDRPLVDLVLGDDDVRQDGDLYRATLAREDLAGLERAPLGLKDAPADWGAEIPVELTVADGLIRKLSVRIPKGILSAEYAELGEPQAIEPPTGG